MRHGSSSYQYSTVGSSTTTTASNLVFPCLLLVGLLKKRCSNSGFEYCGAGV